MKRIFVTAVAMMLFVNLSTIFIHSAFAQIRICDNYKNRLRLLEKRFAKYAKEQDKKLKEIDKKMDALLNSNTKAMDNSTENNRAEFTKERTQAYNALREERTRIHKFYEDKKNFIKSELDETIRFLDNCRRFQ